MTTFPTFADRQNPFEQKLLFLSVGIYLVASAAFFLRNLNPPKQQGTESSQSYHTTM